jgi:ribosomal protein L40E
MARKVLGYIELVWTCDSCGTRNPGAIRSCTSCGAPQPIDVKFERVDPATFNFIKDEALIRMAKAGPDKHCPYCGTRNLAEAQICVKCGGDLTVGATSRPVGEIIEDETDLVQAASTNQADPTRQKVERKPLPKWALIVMILALLACCVFGVMYLTRMNQTDQLDATVSQVYWQRQVPVEAYQLVRASDWESNIPSNAQTYDCQMRYRYDSDTPKQNSEEVCGTPYTIDTGTGVGEVVQDCYYKVYEEYCSYDTMQWVVITTLVEDGYGTNAIWPSTSLTMDQRFGTSTERYTITFSTRSEEYQYTTTDYSLFQQAVPGSDWVIEVNGFGDITAISPD